MNDLFQTNGIYFDNCIKHIKKMSNYYILKPSLSSNNFCIFLDSRYLQWTQSIFTTNFSTDCSQKKMHCAQLQADKKEFVSKCLSFQYFLALFSRIHFFCYEKKWNGKKYLFGNVTFLLFANIIFLSYEGTNQFI